MRISHKSASSARLRPYKKPRKFYCAKSFTVNHIMNHDEKFNIYQNKKTVFFAK